MVNDVREKPIRPENTYLIGEKRAVAPDLPGGLYIVSTPIGNLADITLRALTTLAACDVVACEDTRHTAKLLQHFGIKASTLPYHDHNGARQRPRLLQLLGDGKSIALVSDAGTPLLSDPGYKLVQAACEEGYNIVPIPGASALLAALAGGGMPTDEFWFEGFLPAKQKARQARIGELAAIPGTLILYEAPARVAEALGDLASVLGDRDAVVARELTKLHETFHRGTLSTLAASFTQSRPKGELVILISPAPAPEPPSLEALTEQLVPLVTEHGAKTAAQMLAKQLNLPKKTLYQLAIKIAEDQKHDGAP